MAFWSAQKTFTSTTKGFGRGRNLNGANMGTIDIVAAPDGSHSGSGQGIWTSQAGDMVAWNMYFLGNRKQARFGDLPS
jgi:hypothetical protein